MYRIWGRVCTFDETGTDTDCGYTAEDPAAPLQWSVMMGLSSDSDPAIDAHGIAPRPAYDHTTAEEIGKYLLFESASDVKRGQVARTVSALHHLSNETLSDAPFCLRLVISDRVRKTPTWRHMKYKTVDKK